MERRRRRRGLRRPLGSFKAGFSAAALEALESRCLFNVGPGFFAEYAERPETTYAEYRDDAPTAESRQADAPAIDVERGDGEGRSSEFAAVRYESEFEPQVFVVQPAVIVNFVVIDFTAPREASVQPVRPATTANASPLAASVQSTSAAEATGSPAGKSIVFVASISDSTSAASASSADAADLDAVEKATINSPVRTDQPVRSDAVDPGRQAPASPGLRPQPAVSLTAQDSRQQPAILFTSDDANRLGAENQVRRATESMTNAAGESALARAIAQIGESAGALELADSFLEGLRTRFEGPEAAVAIRSAGAVALGVPGQMLNASSQWLDAKLPWASLSPLLPRLSTDAAELGQAFDAVLGDLDELGDELFASFAAGDRLAIGVSAGGIVAYVAIRHFHGRAALEAAALKRGRRPAALLPRRVRLAVRPVFE